jgi:hypothetical protein
LVEKKNINAHFVKPVNLYHEKGRLTNDRPGNFLILLGHYTRKMAFYLSSKPEGNHANPTHSQTSGSWFCAPAMTTMNKKPTRCTLVLKTLELYCVLILLYVFQALLRPSSGASQFCTNSLQSLCVVGSVVSSSLGLATHGDWRLFVQNWEAPDDGRKSARNT